VVIGKFFSATQLAYYVRALSLKQLPLTNIGASLNSVTLPVFSKSQHDDAALRQLYLRSIAYVAFIIYPVFAYLIVMAPPFITLLLTDKWNESIVFFQWLCIMGFFYPLNSYNTNILIVKGRGKIYIQLELVKKVLTILGIFFAVRFGVMGLVYFQVIFSFVEFLINSYFCGRIISLRALDQFTCVLKPLMTSLGMMLILVLLGEIPAFGRLNNFWQVAFGFLAGGAFYLLASYRFNRDVFEYFWSFREKFNKRAS
jgi:O-antigen/teichoic acid export membrane protein